MQVFIFVHEEILITPGEDDHEIISLSCSRDICEQWDEEVSAEVAS